MKLLPLHQTFVRSVAFFAAVLLTSFASAAPLAVGEPFPILDRIQDQYEAAYPMPAGTRHVVVAFSMSVGKSANRYFAKQGATFLPSKQAVFVSNIHGMPAVGRFFAMPKMKKYPHRIMLADEEGLLDDFSQKEGVVTLFKLDKAGVIESITYWDPGSDLAPF